MSEKRDPLIGSVLAERYLIESLLGSGGFAKVYCATQIKMERTVAIKVLHTHLEKKTTTLQRFKQEAQLASRIRHKNAVSVIDFGEDPKNNLLFLVMEYLEGPTLKKYLQQNTITLAETAQIGMQIALALEAAHNVGVIHRDLKPSNILITKTLDKSSSNHIEAIVIDFGLAKETNLGENTSSLTRSGMILGTPHYLSPEEIRGEKLDHRADLYALGIILYEMLTGIVPFTASTPMAIATNHLFKKPKCIHKATSTLLPKGFAKLVMKLLDKKPENRPQSAHEIAQELETFSNKKLNDKKLKNKAIIKIIVLFLIALITAFFWIHSFIAESNNNFEKNENSFREEIDTTSNSNTQNSNIHNEIVIEMSEQEHHEVLIEVNEQEHNEIVIEVNEQEHHEVLIEIDNDVEQNETDEQTHSENMQESVFERNAQERNTQERNAQERNAQERRSRSAQNSDPSDQLVLNELETVQQAEISLTDCSAETLIQYAESFDLQGNHEEANNAYRIYLDRFPTHSRVREVRFLLTVRGE